MTDEPATARAVESPTVAAPARQRLSLWKTVLFCALGIVAIATGLRQIFGTGDDAAIKKLISASEAAASNAVEHAQAGDKSFADILAALMSQPLATVRTNQLESLKETGQLFAQAVDEFNLAAKILQDALTFQLIPRAEQYVSKKARALELFAEAYGLKGEMIALLLATDQPERDVAAGVRDAMAKIEPKTTEATSINEEANKLARQLADGEADSE